MSGRLGSTQQDGRATHARRLLYLCIGVVLVSAPIAYWIVGPRLPPGSASFQDDNQVFVDRVILTLVLPIYLCVVIAFLYSFMSFRRRSGDPGGDAAPIEGNRRAQRWWIAGSAAIVIFLWAFGTYEWIWAGVGSGGGQGPVPMVRPSGKSLEVQVIGQQWAFTYRYPDYGGFESPHLMLPAGTSIEVHVTSLDVIHSFWAVNLGAKADAVPGFDNVFFIEPLGTGAFEIKCAELCGLWHGQMYDTGEVVAPDRFESWATQQERDFADITKFLPPYAHTYDPKPENRGG
jgi:cytochrome c oxidase subunit II